MSLDPFIVSYHLSQVLIFHNQPSEAHSFILPVIRELLREQVDCGLKRLLVPSCAIYYASCSTQNSIVSTSHPHITYLGRH